MKDKANLHSKNSDLDLNVIKQRDPVKEFRIMVLAENF